MLTSDQKIKINEKVQGFKEAADFYRMEYSQDLMGMFREFGCMLLEACGINAEDDPEIKQLFGYRQVLRGTVKRQLTVIAEELAGLWKAPVSGEMFQAALSGIFDFCLYSRGGKNRYLLPVEIAKPLLGLVTRPEGMLSPGEGETHFVAKASSFLYLEAITAVTLAAGIAAKTTDTPVTRSSTDASLQPIYTKRGTNTKRINA